MSDNIYTEPYKQLLVITLDIDQQIATLRIERPKKGNCLNTNALESFIEKVQAANNRGKVLIIKGEGEFFSAGADLTEIRSFTPARATEFARLGQELTNELADSPLPTIAAVDGYCRGGGLEIALACDLRYATPSASFGEPGVKVGLFGCWGGTYRLPQIVGKGNAMDLSLTGRTIDTAEAKEIGLVSEIVDDLTEIDSKAKELTSFPPKGIQAIKEGIASCDGQSRQESLDHEAQLFGQLFESDLNSRIEDYL